MKHKALCVRGLVGFGSLKGLFAFSSGLLAMKELIFYAVVGLIAAGVRDLVFSFMTSPCEGLCGILATGFIIMVIFGLFRRLGLAKRIFGLKKI